MTLRGTIGALAAWTGLFGLWLLFVMKLSLPECLLDAFSAALAVFATEAFRRTARLRFAPDGRMLLQILCLPLNAVTGTVQVLQALLRHLLLRRPAGGHLASAHYASSGDNPRSATRRALAVGLTTCTPNSVIVGIVREQKLLLYHQMKKRGVPPMTRRLGASP